MHRGFASHATWETLSAVHTSALRTSPNNAARHSNHRIWSIELASTLTRPIATKADFPSCCCSSVLYTEPVELPVIAPMRGEEQFMSESSSAFPAGLQGGADQAAGLATRSALRWGGISVAYIRRLQPDRVHAWTWSRLPCLDLWLSVKAPVTVEAVSSSRQSHASETSSSLRPREAPYKPHFLGCTAHVKARPYSEVLVRRSLDLIAVKRRFRGGRQTCFSKRRNN